MLVFILISAFTISNNNGNIPDGWYPAGSAPNEYEMGVDNKISQNGKSCAYIKSKNPKENEFGTLMQSFSAEDYLGKRLQLSGYIKSENVKIWSGMWMRIDGENNELLGFDNMQNRYISGTTEWKKYKIVLDVPSRSKTINFGVLLTGKGKVWFDNFELKEVDKKVPVTNLQKADDKTTKPRNLDFEN